MACQPRGVSDKGIAVGCQRQFIESRPDGFSQPFDEVENTAPHQRLSPSKPYLPHAERDKVLA